jgi:hypothetical protein
MWILLLLAVFQISGGGGVPGAGGRVENATLAAPLTPTTFAVWFGNEPTRQGQARNVVLILWRGEGMPNEGKTWKLVPHGVQLPQRTLAYDFDPRTRRVVVAGQTFDVTQTNVILIDVDKTSERVVEAFHKDPAMVAWGIEALHVYVRDDPKLAAFAGF